VLLSQNKIQLASPSLIELAEPAVLITVRSRLFIFLPQQLQRDVLVRPQFLMGRTSSEPAAVAGGAHCWPRWKQSRFQFRVIQIRQRPTAEPRGLARRL
jgi:hypothetical protein